MTGQPRKVGVFDSGVGGARVAQAIQEAIPEIRVLYADDHEHIPYGNRSPEEIKSFVVPILEALVEEGCEAIVIACNTVTTTLIAKLAEGNVHTRDDLAELAVDELIEMTGINEEDAKALIMKARAHWFN